MKKSSVLVCICILCTLLAVSLTANLYQLCSRVMAAGQNGTPSEDVSGEKETARDGKEEKENKQVLPERAPAPAPSLETKSVEKVEYPSLVYKDSEYEFVFNDNGVPVIEEMEIQLDGLSEHQTKENLDKITITPKPRSLKKITAAKDKLILKGEFDNVGEYVLNVPHGINTAGGAMPHNSVFIVKLGKPSCIFSFKEPGKYYPVTMSNGKVEKCSLAVDLFGVEELKVSVYKMPDESLDMAGLVSSMGFYYYGDLIQHRMMYMLEEKVFNISGALRRQTLALDLVDMLKELKPGMYNVILGANKLSQNVKRNWWNDDINNINLVVSNLGVSLVNNAAGKKMAVFVRNLDNMAAVPGADVRVFTDKRVLLAQGLTGEDGSVMLDRSGVDSKMGEIPAYVVVSKDGDFSIMDVKESNTLSNAEFANTGKFFADTNAFIYTNRGIYRPGEEVNVSAFVRHLSMNGFKGRAIPCEITISDSRNNVAGRIAAKTNEDGFVTASFKLADDAPGGVYKACCGISGEEPWNCVTFNVGAFIPDRIKASLEADKEVYTEDGKIQLILRGQYYFGKKLTSGHVQFKLYDLGRADIPHWKDYSVGEVQADSDNASAPALVCVLNEVNYSNMSEISLEVEDISAKLAKGGVDFSVPRRLSVVAEVKESGERTVSDFVNFTFSSENKYLGMKYDDSKGGDAIIRCSLLSCDKSVKPVSGKSVYSLVLRRKEWKYLTEQERNQYKRVWREVVVQEEKLEQVLEIDEGGAFLTLKDLPYGHYEIIARGDRGAVTALDFWHWYGDGGSVRSANPAVLTVESDASKYVPGSVAKIKFSGYKGALLVAAGEKELSHVQAVDTVDGMNEVEIPIPATVIGNAYFVELSHVGFTKAGREKEVELSRNYALLRIPIDQSGRKINFSIDTAEKAEPREEIDIAVILDKENKFSGGTVQIFAVDEGILALTNYKTPDIFDFFHGKYYCDFTTSDIYSQIFYRLAMDAPRKIGGDAAGAGLRMAKLKNRESAVVALPVTSFKDGVAKARMKLPDHTGAMRIMVVAVANECVGTASCEITMREKAGVLPLAASVAAVGDSFEGNFKVFNHEFAKCQAVLKVKCSDGLTLNGSPSKTFTIDKGEVKNVSFDFAAAKDGAHSLEYVLEIGGTKIRGEEFVNVRASQPPVTDSRIIVLKPGQEIKSESLEWKKLFESKAVLSVIPSIGAKDSMTWLNEYPYGCLEQTVSCAFPLLSADKLISQGVIVPDMKHQSEAKISLAVKRILAMRRSCHGFAWWPDSQEIWYEASIFAAHFLALVKTPYDDKGVRNDVVYFLRKNAEFSSYSFNRAYASYVLALMNDDFGAKRMLPIYNDKDAVPDMGMLVAGAAVIKAGYAQEGLPLFNRALESRAWRSGETLWYFSSKAMRLAMALSIAMEIVPDNPIVTEMAMELLQLSRNDGSGWGVTGTNAWAAYGLAAYSAKYASKTGEVSVFRGGSERKIVFSREEDVSGFDRIVNTGSGIVVLNSKSRGIPANVPAGGGIEISKVYLDENGKPVTKVKSGDLVTVQIRAKHANRIENAVLVDLLPGGFAIENGGLATRNSMVVSENKGYHVQHSENLQDRFLLFMTSEMGGCTVSYTIRAIIPGEFTVPGISIEDMYDPSMTGRTFSKQKIKIEKR